MFQTSCIELSLSALQRNVRFLKKRIGPKTRFCSVIKGNAYGHGIAHFVPLAEQCGLRHFGVFSADEALEASKVCSPAAELLIMGAVDGDALAWAIEHDIAFFVFDLERLRQAGELSTKIGKKALVHLELETGMNRTGLAAAEVEEALGLVQGNPDRFTLEGVCTHYAGAESISNYYRIRQQMERFGEHIDRIRAMGLKPGLLHSACSAAALNYEQTHMDMVRFGIAHYGFWPSEETRMHFQLAARKSAPTRRNDIDPLRRVLRWCSRVMSTKKVPRGDFVGYGTSYLTSRNQTIATVPVGYYHGFARGLSNLGHVLVRGRRAPVVGLVNMNMMTVDVTDVPGVAKGDEVVIIGKQGKRSISVSSFSDMTRNVNYEVLVRLPAEIPRVVTA